MSMGLTNRLSTKVKKSHHYITMNEEARADIQWWIKFLPTWSQSTIIPETYTTSPTDLRLYTDACDYGYTGMHGFKADSMENTATIQ